MPDNEDIALFDMDGTIVDFDGQMKLDLERMRSPEEAVIDPWDRSYPHMSARRHTIMKQVGWWRALPPLNMGIILLEAAIELGFQINILTKGPDPTVRPSAWTEKAQWCQDNIVRPDRDIKITITEDKGLMYGKVLVDDYPPYITRWLEWRHRGLVIMPDQPWNQEFKHPNVIRYAGAKDLYYASACLLHIKERKQREPLCLPQR